MAGSGSQGGRGVPRKKSNKQRGVRRGRNRDKQPFRKLTRLMRVNGREEARKWAERSKVIGAMALYREMNERREAGLGPRSLTSDWS